MSQILKILGYSEADLQTLTQNALAGGNGGEIFLSSGSSMAVSIKDGVISKGVSFDSGAFLRRIDGIQQYGFDVALDVPSMEKTANVISQIPVGTNKLKPATALGQPASASRYTSADVYSSLAKEDFMSSATLFLQELEAYARAKDSRVVSFSANFSAQEEDVIISRLDGRVAYDTRPMSSLRVSVTIEENGKRETHGGGAALPVVALDHFNKQRGYDMVDSAIDGASKKITAIEAPTGSDMEIVIKGGWEYGVVLHEAIGHSLEADSHRTGASTFAGQLGQQIAAKGVYIYDDGTVAGARGSINVDDEGNPANKTLLVEDGILVGLMTDEISASAMGLPCTGNGRRQSSRFAPIPRMTNTYMQGGGSPTDDLISSVKKGIYGESFAGGQVNTTSGEYVFNAPISRIIENGKLGAYVKGAALKGTGRNSLINIIGIANDFELSETGTCGKGGQSVPVTAGGPTVLLAKGSNTVIGTN